MRASRNRRLTALIIIALATFAGYAQTHPNQQQGFDAEKVYHIAGVDAVNTFNGNLVVTLPIGSRYKIGPNLDYGLSLIYNSKPWESYGFESINSVKATPNRRANAGIGWTVSLGRLLGPDDETNNGLGTRSWVYVAPDGHDEGFIVTDDRPSSALSSSGRRRLVLKDATHVVVQSPDGSEQEFERLEGLGITDDWRLRYIRDTFGNRVEITYAKPSETEETWTVRHVVRSADDVPFERKTVLSFRKRTDIDFQDVHIAQAARAQWTLESVTVPRFDDGTCPPDSITPGLRNCTATYSFEYDKLTVRRPSWDTDNGGLPRPAPTMYFLTKFTSPSGDAYSMRYVSGSSDACSVTSAGCGGGYLEKLTYPTGGGTRWEYAVFDIEGSGFRNMPHEPVHAPPDHTGPFPSPVFKQREFITSVSKRVVLDAKGADHATYTYTTDFMPPKKCPGGEVTWSWTDSGGLTNTVQWEFQSVMSRAITDPAGVTTVTYYSVYNAPLGDCENSLWQGEEAKEEYGLPINRLVSSGTFQRASDSAPRSLFLSTEILTNASSTMTNGRLTGTRKRSTYVAYQSRWTPAIVTYLRPVQIATRTIFDQDTGCGNGTETCYVEEYLDSYDGVGNHRKVSTGGNFPGSNFRTTFKNYVGRRVDPFGVLPGTVWLLDRYTETCEREDAALNMGGVSSCQDLAGASMQTYCFHPATGFLTRTRKVRNSVNVGPDDLVTEFTMNTAASGNGEIAKERYFGGYRANTQPWAFPSTCEQINGETPTYSITHGYSFGVRNSSQYDGALFKTLDADVDPRTGFITASRDSAGNQTDFTYDLIGRLETMKAPGSAAVSYAYEAFDAAAERPPRVTVLQTGQRGSKSGIYEYDFLGRLTREKALLAEDGTWSVRETVYDSSGRKEKVSEVERFVDGTSPSKWTEYLAFDTFGRPTRIRRPDRSTSTAVYTAEGERELVESICNDAACNSRTELTRKTFDSSKQLVQVTEPSGPTSATSPTGAPVTSSYDYDEDGRLISVDMTGADAVTGALRTQSRRFTYDDLGLLRTEQHPEKSGPVSYEEYDARGHARRVIEGDRYGKFDLRFDYDVAERLHKVSRNQTTNSLPVKELIFGNSPGSTSFGLLESDLRHNYVNGGDVKVKQSYTYLHGRVTDRVTDVSRDGTLLQSFTQSFAHGDLGELVSMTYPSCTSCGISGRAIGTLNPQYSNGYLTAIPSFATAVTYHPWGGVHKISHETSTPGRTQTDTYSADPSGIARVGSISFDGYCIGPPISSADPVDRMQPSGAGATLSVPPAPNRRYQWYEGSTGDTSRAVGSDSPTFDVPPLEQSARYWVRVTDTTSSCSSDSRTATVHVSCAGIRITEAPHDDDIAGGETATFTIVASGTDLVFEWFQGLQGQSGVPLGSGTLTAATSGTRSTFTTSPLTETTRFWVRITSASRPNCLIASATVEARVCPPVVIVEQPSDHFPTNTTDVPTARIVVAGGAKFNYAVEEKVGEQWATRWSVADTHVVSQQFQHSAAGVGTYRFVVESCGTRAISREFRLGRCVAPTVSQYGPGVAIVPFSGSTAELRVDFTATDPPTPLTLQWYRGDGAAIAGATSNVLLAYGDTDGETYYVRATNLCGSVVSPVMYVAVYGTCPVLPARVTPSTAVLDASTTRVRLRANVAWHDAAYRWYAGEPGNKRVALGTGPELDVNTVGTYWFEATLGCGRTIEGPMATVKTQSCDPAVIRSMTPPSDMNVAAGTEVELAVDAGGSPQPGAFHWREHPGDPRLEAAVSPTHQRIVRRVDKTTTFSARVSNGCSSALSRDITIHVTSCGSTVLTQQPADTTIERGQTAALVGVVNDASANFQWYAGRTGDITSPLGTGTMELRPGGRASTFVTPALDAPGAYWLRVTTPAGCLFDSRTAIVDVCERPFVPTGTQGVNVQRGQGVWITFNARGTDLKFEWFGGSSPNTSQPLGVTQQAIFVRAAQTERYWMRVSNRCGSVASGTLVLSVCPTIEEHPASATVMPNTRAMLHARGDGTELVYEWFMGHAGDTSRPIGTGPSVETPPITAETRFWCRVSSGTCMVASHEAVVSLCDVTAVDFAPGTRTKIRKKELQTINVIATPEGSYDYTWYTGPVGDVHGSTLYRSPTAAPQVSIAPEATISLWARASRSGTACYGISPSLTLDVCVPTITTHPESTMITSRETATLTVKADIAPVTYQWYRGTTPENSTEVAGATGPTLEVASAQAGQYWVQVKGSCNLPENSRVASVTVCVPPTITAPLVPQKAHAQTSVTLSMTANGTGLSYEWYRVGANGVASLIGTTAVPAITVQVPSTADYRVRVVGSCGTIENTARVSVWPVLTAAPSPAVTPVTRHTAATFTVAAAGEPLVYRWFRGARGDDSAPHVGTGSTFVTPLLTTTSTFWVRITSGDASIDAGPVTAEVCASPAIHAQQPSTAAATEVTLIAEATSPGLEYQFYRGTSGNTSQPVGMRTPATTFKVTPYDRTDYWVREFRNGCHGDSPTLTVHVCEPAVLVQPATINMNIGMTVAISVSAVGPAPLSYQWYEGARGDMSKPIAGGTSNQLAVSPTVTTRYWARVANGCGYVYSDAGTVNVCAPPVVNRQPLNAAPVYYGATAELSIDASGVDIRYQWFRGGSGDTRVPVGSGLSTLSLAATETAPYWVYTYTPCGAANSNHALISVYPRILSQPASQTVPVGATARLTVAADGNDLHYQWYRSDGPHPVGTDSPVFDTPPVTAAARYYCSISSGLATVMSAEAVVGPCELPRIESGPATSTLAGGCKVVFVTLVEDDRGTASYHWYRGPRGDTSTRVSQASSFQSCAATKQTYWCRITNTATGCVLDTDALEVMP